MTMSNLVVYVMKRLYANRSIPDHWLKSKRLDWCSLYMLDNDIVYNMLMSSHIAIIIHIL